MSKVTILQTINLPKKDFLGLALVNGKVWFAGVDKGNIHHGEIVSYGKFENRGETVSKARNLGGLAWDGIQFYTVDQTAKQILRTTPKREDLELVLSLRELKPSLSMPLVFLSDSVTLTGMSWGKGLLWFGCKAGYSSAFYAIDINRKQVAFRFGSRGTEPDGISFDKAEQFLWTLDSRKRELSKYTGDNQFAGETLSVPVESPTGLIIDDKNTFWTADRKNGKLFQIEREAN